MTQGDSGAGGRGIDGGVSRRGFVGALAGGAAAAGLAGCAQRAATADGLAARKPNVVVLFADDMGYGGLGCFGSSDIATPNIDRMAAEGTRFTDFYCSSPVCTPSRSSLLTGTYAARIGLASGVLFPNARIGLSPGEITIAKLLKGQGYATACIGKWHLGDAPEFSPATHGFDSYFGLPYSNDMRIQRDGKSGPPLMRDGRVIEHPADQATLTERYTEEAIRVMTANRDRPFFIYLPHTMPHIPLYASERFRGRSKRGLYGDVVECLDWSTGEILAALKRLGLDDDTLVIFTSDNGPWLEKKQDGGGAGPLRAGKGTVYEGGMRVPCVMRFPGKVPAGRTCSELATTIDLLPTAARLAGAEAPKDRVIDGRDIWPLMSGVEGARTPHEAYFYHGTNAQLQAVRSEQWKLHLPRRRAATATAPATQIGPELYDLAADVGEKANVAGEHPDMVRRLTALADGHRADLAKNSRPVGRTNRPVSRPAAGPTTERGANE